MKKSLLAIAGTAQAQSSVTLFGTLDEAGYYANQVNKSTASQACFTLVFKIFNRIN